jgi:hypothetical protein
MCVFLSRMKQGVRVDEEESCPFECDEKCDVVNIIRQQRQRGEVEEEVG